MGKTRDLFKKIRHTKGTFHANMGAIKDRNGVDLTEAEEIKKRWQEHTENKAKTALSCVPLLWTVARQAPLPMVFSRQEYWSGLSFPSPGDLPDPGIEPMSPVLQAGSLPTE